jgi:hypothetical protein
LPEFFLLKYLFQKNMMRGSCRVRREGFRRLAPDPVLSPTGKTSPETTADLTPFGARSVRRGPPPVGHLARWRPSMQPEVARAGQDTVRNARPGPRPFRRRRWLRVSSVGAGAPVTLITPLAAPPLHAVRRYRDNPATFCAVEVTCLSEIPTEIGVSCFGPLPPVPSCPSSLRPQAQSFPAVSMA